MTLIEHIKECQKLIEEGVPESTPFTVADWNEDYRIPNESFAELMIIREVEYANSNGDESTGVIVILAGNPNDG